MQDSRQPNAEAQAKHRRGVKAELREIRVRLDDLRREVQARLDGLVEVMAEQQRERPQ